MWGLINHHDRACFEVHLFSDAPATRIEHGYQKRPEDGFCDISAMSNEQVAQLIQDKGIDILVDLNGYSRLGRLGVLMLRPAPVVVGWFNMYATSGLDCLDYLIGDDHVVQAQEQGYYTEQIVRVPGCYLAFEVIYPVPEVGLPPCTKTASITFGALASQYKITPQVIQAWAHILQRCPECRMIIKNKALGSACNRRFVHECFDGLGIPEDRVLYVILGWIIIEFLIMSKKTIQLIVTGSRVKRARRIGLSML